MDRLVGLWRSIPSDRAVDSATDWMDPDATKGCVSLGEGQTPLIPARRWGRKYGLTRLFLKLESISPTGSYKDRFAAAAVTAMLAQRKTHCVATSSGNTGAALAAYCAAAEISCSIAIVETAPVEKLQQMLAYGARLIKVQGFGIDPVVTASVFAALELACQDPRSALQISAYRYSPAGMSGVQTISYELSNVPVAHLFAPAGGGGLALAIVRGFQKLVASGRMAKSPAVHVVQPQGNDTIASPLAQGEPKARAVSCTSQISGLQVATVIDGDQLVTEAHQSGGTGVVVSDQEVWRIQAELAEFEGVFCEPAAAVSVAGAVAAVREGRIDPDSPIVCIITGTGFKDQSAVTRMVASRNIPVVSAADLPTCLRGET